MCKRQPHCVSGAAAAVPGTRARYQPDGKELLDGAEREEKREKKGGRDREWSQVSRAGEGENDRKAGWLNKNQQHVLLPA